ncbi:MAG: OmpA family protein [Acidobacteriota bacterium]
MRSARQARVGESEGRHRDRWLISYADLVTLMLALFIVMYAASDKERARIIAESFTHDTSGGSGILPGMDSKTDSRDAFEKKLRADAILMQKAKVRQGKDGLIVSLSEAGFFAPGEAAISLDAEIVIGSLADLLKSSGQQIRIEGHTDSTPISNVRYPSNWELSTARASTVLSRLVDLGISPERLSAAGYGGFQPVADNSTIEGRAQNRRVDVVVLDH